LTRINSYLKVQVAQLSSRDRQDGPKTTLQHQMKAHKTRIRKNKVTKNLWNQNWAH